MLDQLYPMHKIQRSFVHSKVFRHALYLSILIHLLLIISYVNLRPLWKLVPLLNVTTPTEIIPVSEPLNFEIVDSPDLPESEPDPDAHRYSDRNLAAHDQKQDLDLPAADPFADGQVPIAELPTLASAEMMPTEFENYQETPSENPVEEKPNNSVYTEPDFASIFTGKPTEAKQESEPATHQPPSLRQVDANLFKNAISKANAAGDFSFSTYDFDWYDYARRLKERVRSNWYVPDAFRKLGLISGRTLVSFTILPDGSVINFQVLQHEGDESLEISSSNAIELSSPFDKLPPDFPDEQLDVTFGFYYLLPGQEMAPFRP